MSRPVVFLGGPADGKTVSMTTPLPVVCAIPYQEPPFYEKLNSRPTPSTRAATYRLAKVASGGRTYPVYRDVDEPERVIERLMMVHLRAIQEAGDHG